MLTINLKMIMKFLKLFKKQKENGGSGETTIYLEKNCEIVGVEFIGSGGGSGSSEVSVIRLVSCPSCGNFTSSSGSGGVPNINN